jgi:hypothetical protein
MPAEAIDRQHKPLLTNVLLKKELLAQYGQALAAVFSLMALS